MTHELKHIVAAYRKAREIGQSTVLASVVALEGSSYRRPGVRMLLMQNGAAYGAVSGGCVEKEVHRQAQSVFQNGVPKMMTYDGRYRLGCEGILHILLEPFNPGEVFLQAFDHQIADRVSFALESWYQAEDGANPAMGTNLLLKAGTFPCSTAPEPAGLQRFHQSLEPCMRLELFGGEHDAVQLSSLARQMGWEVRVTVTADESKSHEHFPGATEFRAVVPEATDLSDLDAQTAVVLMTHSYTKDLKYLMGLAQACPGYLAVLGPAARRERLLGDVMERMPAVDACWLDSLHGPAGLDIGAETPQEIGISILAEILAVFRNKKPVPLRDKAGAIHDV